MFTYSAKVKRVIDGDTVDLLVDLGLRVTVDARVRLLGLNAPEKNTSAGVAAKQFLEGLLGNAASLTVKTEKDRTEKYGRWLGTLYDENGVSINDRMVAEGYAAPYDGGPR